MQRKFLDNDLQFDWQVVFQVFNNFNRIVDDTWQMIKQVVLYLIRKQNKIPKWIKPNALKIVPLSVFKVHSTSAAANILNVGHQAVTKHPKEIISLLELTIF